MPPTNPLPHSPEFSSPEEYISSLLTFTSTSPLFQTLCGGVHIVDFFTRTPSLYHSVIPEEWREWLMARDEMSLLSLLMRDDLSTWEIEIPESLLAYIRQIRRLSLRRDVTGKREERKLPRQVTVGMIPKKIHEVSNFADYVVRVADSVEEETGKGITHFVDFGSGQNYLGRTLASPPYNKHIVAVESKEINISGAKGMDILAGLAEREKVRRNKKIFRANRDAMKSEDALKDKEKRRMIKEGGSEENGADLRPSKELNTIYTPGEGKGYIQYVEHIVKDGDLSNVVSAIEKLKLESSSGNLNIINGAGEETVPELANEISKEEETRLMAISIHSCGNLSHHGIRSLVLNPEVHAIAIVGCCYNLLGERLGPPTFKLPLLRPTHKAINASPDVAEEIAEYDAHGFPMSEKVGTFGGEGIRLNITARMMAVQAPQNWTSKESDQFFTRHFYRALLQKVFLDYGVVKMIPHTDEFGNPTGLEGTEPVIIGSLRPVCFTSFTTYVRSAFAKLSNDPDPEKGRHVLERMEGVEDAAIESYLERYGELKKELSVMWSLMAFSAGVVESLIVCDRWLYLKEQKEVQDAWVEAVFEYGLSPRNLVVVGVKK